MIRRSANLLTLATLLVAAALAGCYEERIVRDSFADLRAMSDGQRRPNRGPRQLTGRAMGAGWSILLAEFSGRDRQERANRLVRQLVLEAKVPDLWVEGKDDKARVLRGVYPSETMELAQTDLMRTRAIVINGSEPFANARMVPLGVDGAVVTDSDYDLRRYSGMLTLQINYYDSQMGPNFRKLAEDAVKALRADGTEAYFYHGPNMSLITVGLFTEDDRVQRVFRTPSGRDVIMSEYSERVRALQRQFPYAMGNGRTQIDTDEAGEGKPLESFLVRAP